MVAQTIHAATAARFPEGAEVRHEAGWTGVITTASSQDPLAQGHIADVAGPIVHVCWPLDNGHVASEWFRPYVLSPVADAVPARTRTWRGGAR